MVRQHLIILCFICKLVFLSLAAKDEILDNGNYLFDLKLFNANTTNKTSKSLFINCKPTDRRCIYEYLGVVWKDKTSNSSKIKERNLIINQLANFDEDQNTDVNNSGVNRNNSIWQFDFSECGTYPACSIIRLSDTKWSYVCDQSLVSLILFMGAFLCIIIIFSNLAVVVITLSTKSLRKPHGYFKLSLALADLVAGLFVVPSILHNTLNKMNYSKQVFNTSEIINIASGVDDAYTSEGVFFGVAGVLTTIAGVYSLLLLSIDTFLSICWPMQYRIGDILNSKRAICIVLLVWLVSLNIAFLPVLAKQYLTYGLTYYTFQYIPIVHPKPKTTINDSSAYRYSHAIVYAVFVWGIPFVITWILTILSTIRSRKMLRNMRKARKVSDISVTALNDTDREIVRTVTTVLSLFTITILPIFALTISLILAPQGVCTNTATGNAYFVTSYIFICGRFLNAMVYNVFNKEFRKASREVLGRVVRFICCYHTVSQGTTKTCHSATKPFIYWKSPMSRARNRSEHSKTKVTEHPPSIVAADNNIFTNSVTEIVSGKAETSMCNAPETSTSHISN